MTSWTPVLRSRCSRALAAREDMSRHRKTFLSSEKDSMSAAGREPDEDLDASSTSDREAAGSDSSLFASLSPFEIVCSQT